MCIETARGFCQNYYTTSLGMYQPSLEKECTVVTTAVVNSTLATLMASFTFHTASVYVIAHT
jgi:hypothetical protein